MLRSRRPLLFAAAGALALTAGQAWAGAGRWTPFGPGGGYVEQVLLEPALDPAGGDALYAVTVAGAFRSANAGVTWRGCGGELFDPLELSAPRLFLAPSLPGTLLATRNGAIYRSIDDCLHWTLLSKEGALLAVLAGDVPGGPPVLLAAGGSSLLRSRDGGSTWDELTIDARPEDGFFRMLAADPGSPKTLYAMFGNPETELKTIYRSDDGGDAWRLLGAVPGPVPPGEQVCLTVAPARPGIVYAVVGTIVYRSADAGATWTQKGQTFANCVEVSPLSPDVLWSVGYFSLSGSQDGGKTWSELDAGLPGPYEIFSSYKVLSAAADPRLPGVLWAGTRGSGVRRSADGGRTWRMPGLQRGLTNLPVTALRLDPWDPGRLYITLVGSADAATAPPVLRSRDGGRTWRGFAQELSTPQVSFTDLAFDRHDPQSLWAAQSLWTVGNSALFHSADRGKTWTAIGLIPPTGRLTVLDAETLLIDGDGVWRSTDGGLTWAVVLPARSLELLVDPRQPAILYDRVYELGPEWHQKVYKSRDGGATWHRMIDNSGVLAVDPKRAGRLFSVKNGGVLMSLDRGVTWRRVGALGGEVHALRMDLHVADVLYAATDQGLWWSRDAGVTWQAVPAGLAPIGRNDLWDIVVDPFRPLYLYGLPAGGGIYEIDLREIDLRPAGATER